MTTQIHEKLAILLIFLGKRPILEKNGDYGRTEAPINKRTSDLNRAGSNCVSIASNFGQIAKGPSKFTKNK